MPETKFPDSYYQVLGAIHKYAEENGTYGKPHTQPGFYDLCHGLWDGNRHWSVGRFRSLSMVNRFLGCQTKREYDVAVHTYNVTMLCMIMIEELRSKGIEIDDKFKVAVYERAMLHDCTESISMDIPYFVKQRFDSIVEEVIVNNNELLNLNWVLTSIAVEPDHSGLVNFFVRIADTMELALFCLEENLLGNSIIDHGKPVLWTCMNLLCQDYTDRLEKEGSEIAIAITTLLEDFREFIHYQGERGCCAR